MARKNFFSPCTKYCLGSAMLVCCMFGVYMMYFNKGPASDIMAANLRKTLQDDGAEMAEEEYGNDASTRSRNKWENFIRQNGYVSIGELYNKCEDDKDRVMMGKTIMMADPVLGGVKSRTIANITWANTIDDGDFSIEVSYNNKELYSNKWDLCTLDEDEKDRVVFCPLVAGYKEYVKDRKIPNYLPKGRYVTKAKVTNQVGEIVGCAFSDFVL